MKKLFSILTFVVCLITFSSCSGSTVANAGEEFKLLGLDDLKGETTEVIFWHSFGHNITTALDPLIESFEEEMAEQGINISVSAEAIGGGYDGLRQRVNLGTKQGKIPTMVLGYPDHFADYISNGIMLPLDSFVKSTDSEIGIADTTDFIASYWSENQMAINGETHTVGIPFNKSTEVMVYNASACDPILKQLGYIAELGEIWKNPTWEQVFIVSQAIKDKQAANNLVWGYDSQTGLTNYTESTYKSATTAKYPVIVDSAANMFITTSRQFGGAGKYTNAQGQIVFNNASNKETQAYFLEKATAELWNLPDKVHQSYGSNSLLNLETFITIGSTAGIKNNTSSKFEVKVTTMPQKEGSENKAVIQQGTNAAILTKNSNNKTRLAAWLLIKYLTSTENTAKFSKATGYLPVRQSAINLPSYQSFLADTGSVFHGEVAKCINAAYEQQSYLYTDPAFSGSSIVRDKVDVMMLDIYVQDKTIDKAFENAYAALKKLRLNVVD